VRIYLDSSALIKRSVDEAESEALDAALDRFVVDDAVLVTSSLAWIEVSRALRAALDDGRGDEDETIEAIDVALSGVAERPITDEVVGLARRIAPPRLRTLDAIHLATAVLLDVDVMLTYDSRVVDAGRHNGVTVLTPS
jgi:predicted nucleic acid-binding protein